MKHFGIEIKTNLEVRTIERDGDIDLFILTLGYPIHLSLADNRFSRLQFPTAKAVLLRLSPKSLSVTCHVLRDVDLFSSFVNFEVHTALDKIVIYKKEGYIVLSFNEKGNSNDFIISE